MTERGQPDSLDLSKYHSNNLKNIFHIFSKAAAEISFLRPPSVLCPLCFELVVSGSVAMPDQLMHLDDAQHIINTETCIEASSFCEHPVILCHIIAEVCDL